MAHAAIVVSDYDVQRLRNWVSAAQPKKTRPDQEHLGDLRAELDRAEVRAAAEIPSEVVRMHSRVSVVDLTTGERQEYVLVYPPEANLAAKRISVLAPLGIALLGYREGDKVEWAMPGGTRRIRLESVLPGVAWEGFD